MDEVRARAREAKCLEERINRNAAAQQLDLGAWIFDRVAVRPGANVLELCSGTGNQTLTLLEQTGGDGRVVAVDISEEALTTLEGKISREARSTLVTVRGDMDTIAPTLEERIPRPDRFDLIFCAYGLYYSQDAAAVLDGLVERLDDDGRLVIVGPFGPNNRPLFDLLGKAGVEIPEYVRYTSQDFMHAEVLPWMSERFRRVVVHTAINEVRWTSPDEVFDYWHASTFYDEARSADVRALIDGHFETESSFVNEKWIMLANAGDDG